MNNCEKTGIVRLEDLPPKRIYLKFDKFTFGFIKRRIKKRQRYITHFLKDNNLNNSNFWDWYTEKSLLRLDQLKSVLKGLNIKNLKIEKFRLKQGTLIENRPFDFTTKEGIRFIASIFGDGCIHEKGIRYYNKDKGLINNFSMVSKKIFGDIKIKVNKNKVNVFMVSLPKMCKVIINQMGLNRDSKILNKIPDFIYNLKEERLLEFISTLIDDDGSIVGGKIYVHMAFKKEPIFLYNLQKMLKTLNVNCSVYPIKRCRSAYKVKGKMWRLGIFSFDDIAKIGSKLNLKHKEKQSRLKKTLLNPRKTPYNGTKPYIANMVNIQKQKGFFTVLELANNMNRSISQCKKIVLNIKKRGLITILESPYNDIKYKVIN